MSKMNFKKFKIKKVSPQKSLNYSKTNTITKQQKCKIQQSSTFEKTALPFYTPDTYYSQHLHKVDLMHLNRTKST